VSAGSWWWSERREGAVLGFTQRGQGASEGIHRGLNLGLHVDDVAERVEANRAVVREGLAALAGLDPSGVRPVFMHQVHGARVRVVTGDEDGTGPGANPQACDALVTTTPHLALFALVADCTPVLLVDAAAGVAAAVHAGRPGMLAGIVPAAVSAMRALGARHVSAVVGPSVCGRCYEVPAAMREEAAAVEPVSAAVTWSGTPALDVASGVVEQLRRDDVEVTWVAGCTKEDESLYSYRRDGITGRFAGVVMLTHPTGSSARAGRSG
jgi:YfiH family protein